MPRAKQTIPCGHCGKDFTQARKDQKYCSPTCRFAHFFDGRDNEKAQIGARIMELEGLINTRDETIVSLGKHLGEYEETIEARNAQIKELEAQLHAARTPKKTTRPKALTS
jgi:uncharacterized coiled-coil protein SlyX